MWRSEDVEASVQGCSKDRDMMRRHVRCTVRGAVCSRVGQEHLDQFLPSAPTLYRGLGPLGLGCARLHAAHCC